MNYQRTTIILAIAVGCTTGFIMGRIWSDCPDSNAPSTAADQPNDPKATRALRSKPQSTGDSGHTTANQAIQSAHGLAQTAHTAQSILSNSDVVERARTWARFVDTLDASGCEEVANRLLQGGYSKTRIHELRILLSQWAKQDPLSALTCAQEQDAIIGRRILGSGTSLCEAALASWATTDPEAAIDYASSDILYFDSRLMCGVIQGLAGKDPTRANELLTEMPPSHERCKAIQALTSHYLTKGPEAARSWATDMEDPLLRRDAIGEVSLALAKSDPKGVLDWLRSNADSAPSYATILAEDELLAAEGEVNRIRSMRINRNPMKHIVGPSGEFIPLWPYH